MVATVGLVDQTDQELRDRYHAALDERAAQSARMRELAQDERAWLVEGASLNNDIFRLGEEIKLLEREMAVRSL